MAAHFDIDRNQVGTEDFPVLLPGNPEPASFCTECLQWFDETVELTDESTR